MKFIHFGCWNRGGCQMDSEAAENVSDFTRVARHIKSNLEGVEFISVAGDNYYPDKEKKKDKADKGEKADKKDKGDKKDKANKSEKKDTKKTLVTNDLGTGFKCLMDIPVDKYIVLGNHELDDKITHIQTSKTSNNARNVALDNKCVIINTQKEIVSSEHAKANKTHFYSDNILSKYDPSSKTLLIMFDTTIYEIKDDKPIQETCYKELAITKSLGGDATIGTLKAEQEKMIMVCVNKHKHMQEGINNLVLVGHHPIIGVKQKNDTKNKDTSPGLALFLANNMGIFQEFNKLYYLCADIHLYQAGNVNISMTVTGASEAASDKKELVIHQYIVGTGGAEKDKVYIGEDAKDTNESVEKVKLDDGNILTITQVITENKRTNGYLVCNANIDGLTCEFVDVGPGDESSNKAGVQKGGKRLSKSKKYRSKKKSRKLTKKQINKIEK